MASVNKVILVGNCGKDPEMRYLPSGAAVASVTLATSSRRKDKNSGEWIEDTQWHRVSFFDKLADIAGEYVRKGRQIYVEGRLRYGKYTDQQGIERNTVEIVASELMLLGHRDTATASTDDSGHRPARPAMPNTPPSPPPPTPPRSATASPMPSPATGGSGFSDMDDDIPF